LNLFRYFLNVKKRSTVKMSKTLTSDNLVALKNGLLIGALDNQHNLAI
jgi:hypothetical protein